MVKKLNVGMTIRSAVAFGAEVVVAGPRAVSTFGDQGTTRHTRLHQFDRLRDAVGWLRGRGVTICGIEITQDAAPVQSHPFRGPTAFLAGSEGEGLCDAHKALCDHFVYVPHYGSGTASLNVTVATSIVLHHFGVWAGYAEAPRESGRDKFVVAALPAKRGPVGEWDAATQDARRRARAEAEAAEAAGEVAGFAEATDGADELEGEDEGEGEGEGGGSEAVGNDVYGSAERQPADGGRAVGVS
jgi:tRNA(Leu) C34 or U34 (ribose-2'-O)-methylase TrmL